MKKTFQRLLSVLLTLTLIVSCMPMDTAAFFGGAAKKDVVLQFTTDKRYYALGETVTLTVTATNTTDDVKSVKVTVDPQQDALFTFEKCFNIENIPAHGTKTVEYQMTVADHEYRSLFGNLLNLFAGIFHSYIRFDYKININANYRNRPVGFTVSESISDESVGYKLSFAETENGIVDTNVAGNYDAGEIIELSATPNENYVFVKWESSNGGTFENDRAASTSFTMPAADTVITAVFAEDGVVPEEIAELFGVDPDDYDTDGDGLSNYIEIYKTSTDPLIIDTDGDGVNDGAEDEDKDGLTNIEEVELGTEVNVSDSDYDGLSDYDEVNTYKTKPTNSDTDGDSLDDGDEILLGLDPLNPKTDGKTNDADRKIEQTLSVDNLDEELISDENNAVPSLDMTTSGNINNQIVIETTASNDFIDSRAIVGEAIDVIGDKISNAKLTFTLKNKDDALMSVDGVSEKIRASLICKYNEDGSVEYFDTEYNETENSISTSIDSDGTYYVLNVKNLFDELGLTISSSGTSVAKKAKASVSGAMAQADIIFIIDTTGSMGDEIDNVKNNINSFVDNLKTKGISAAFALVDYQDITHDGYDSTRVHKNGTSNWFYDIDLYKTAISKLYPDDGGDWEETAVDALETARLLDMRESAGKIFVLVTDAGYKDDNRYGIPSMSAEIELLKNAGVSCSVISCSDEKSLYSDLYTNTNGIWADIYGDFDLELNKIADKIGEEIVGDGFWIYLEGPVPVPVRLDEEPTADGTADTDGDGLLDKEELDINSTGEVDLDELLTIVSDGIITGTNYGIVKSYKYKSSPVESDTDFDGILDENDPEPNNSSSYGKMYGYYNIKNAEYTWDYRDIIDNVDSYDNDLAMVSLILANNIYSDSKFEYTTGEHADTIEDMMSRHGFEGVERHHLATDYSDDDITEFCIGYHDVEYAGTLTRIIGIVIRGTNGTIEEWSSNFDVGDTSTWKSERHKGFSVTSDRVSLIVDEYAMKYGTSNDVYWLTGHSRAAAIANLLAADLIDDGKKTVCYTFATPATTTYDYVDSSKYDSIFNVVNESDLISYVPLEQWGFDRYGVTISVSVKGNTLSEWKNQTGNKSYSAPESKLISKLLNQLANGCAKTWDEVHDRTGAQNITTEQLNHIPIRALSYCDLVERDPIITEDTYALSPSTAFALQYVAEFLGSKKTVVNGETVKIVERTTEEKGDKSDMIIELLNTKYAVVLLSIVCSNGTDIWAVAENASDDYMKIVGDAHATASYYVCVN